MPNIVDPKLQLCELTIECPSCEGTGLYPSPSRAAYLQERVACDCHPRGRVPLLDPDGKFGLRVKCGGYNLRDDLDVKRHFHREVGWADNCQGYTPTTDLWAYVGAAWKDQFGAMEGSIIEALIVAWSNGQNAGEAAFGVVADKLLAKEEET